MIVYPNIGYSNSTFTICTLSPLACLWLYRERWALVQEEKAILKALEKGATNDALDERLGEVYEQLEQINASSAEAKARRILFGLGFDAEMQVCTG